MVRPHIVVLAIKALAAIYTIDRTKNVAKEEQNEHIYWARNINNNIALFASVEATEVDHQFGMSGTSHETRIDQGVQRNYHRLLDHPDYIKTVCDVLIINTRSKKASVVYMG